MKTAVDHDDAWKQQWHPGDPHGWVQWKGTDACIDIHCECGQMSHVDGDFLYYVRCPHCKRVFFLNGHIEMIHMTVEPTSARITEADP